jgi:DNA N-6-adenine-methyltransferase (Dam)
MKHNAGEWYIAREHVDMARAVMRGIDLDPASCDIANATVRATLYYSKADDGLTKVWSGNVWLNPPFKLTGPFMRKLIDEFEAGRVSQAIVLTPNATDTGWFQRAFRACAVLFLPASRLHFHRPHNLRETYLGGQRGHVLFYFGPNANRFARVFGSLGLVAVRSR